MNAEETALNIYETMQCDGSREQVLGYIQNKLEEYVSQFKSISAPAEGGGIVGLPADKNFGVRLMAAIDKKMQEAGMFDLLLSASKNYDAYKKLKEDFFHSLDSIEVNDIYKPKHSPLPQSVQHAGEEKK